MSNDFDYTPPPDCGHKEYHTETCASCIYKVYSLELQRVIEERDEARAKAEKDSTYAQNAVDKICHYRNLAIVLGAKPEHMIGEFDRKLCAEGIDKDNNSKGYHMSVQDVLDDTAETWAAYDSMKQRAERAEAEVERLEERLQFDPGGGDRIDELEYAVMVLRAALLTVAERQRDACKAYLLQCAREIQSDGGDAHLADALFRAAVRVDYAPLVAPEEDK
jgi:hypothetical protein